MSVSVTCPRCILCGEHGMVEMPAEAFARWHAGEFLQVAWPEGSPEQREMLITGTHPACWDQIMDESGAER